MKCSMWRPEYIPKTINVISDFVSSSSNLESKVPENHHHWIHCILKAKWGMWSARFKQVFNLQCNAVCESQSKSLKPWMWHLVFYCHYQICIARSVDQYPTHVESIVDHAQGFFIPCFWLSDTIIGRQIYELYCHHQRIARSKLVEMEPLTERRATPVDSVDHAQGFFTLFLVNNQKQGLKNLKWFHHC